MSKYFFSQKINLELPRNQIDQYQKNQQINVLDTEQNIQSSNQDNQLLKKDIDIQEIMEVIDKKQSIEIQQTKQSWTDAGKVKQIEFSLDEFYIIVLYDNGLINIFKTQNLQLIKTFENLNCQCFTSDTGLIYLGINKQLQYIDFLDFKLNFDSHIKMSLDIIQIQVSQNIGIIAIACANQIQIHMDKKKNKINCKKFLYMKFCPFESYFIYAKDNYQFIVLNVNDFQKIYHFSLANNQIQFQDQSLLIQSPQNNKENNTIRGDDVIDDSVLYELENENSQENYEVLIQISNCGQYCAIFKNNFLQLFNHKFQQLQEIKIQQMNILNVIFDQDQLIIYNQDKVLIYLLNNMKQIQCIDQFQKIENIIIQQKQQKILVQINQTLNCLSKCKILKYLIIYIEYQSCLYNFFDVYLLDQFKAINNVKFSKDYLIMTTIDGLIYVYEKYHFRLINIHCSFSRIKQLHVLKNSNTFMIDDDKFFYQVFQITKHQIIQIQIREVDQQEFYAVFSLDFMMLVQQNGKIELFNFQGQVKLFKIEPLTQSIQLAQMVQNYLVIITEDQVIQIYFYYIQGFQQIVNLDLIDESIQKVILIKNKFYFFGDTKIFIYCLKEKQLNEINLIYQSKYLDNIDDTFLIEKQNGQIFIFKNQQFVQLTQDNNLNQSQFIDSNTLVYRQDSNIRVAKILDGNSFQRNYQKLWIQFQSINLKLLNMKDQFSQFYILLSCLLNFATIILDIVLFQNYFVKAPFYFEFGLVILILPIVVFFVICIFHCFYDKDEEEFTGCCIQCIFVSFIYFGFSSFFVYKCAELKEYDCQQCQLVLKQKENQSNSYGELKIKRMKEKAQIVLKLRKQILQRNINFSYLNLVNYFKLIEFGFIFPFLALQIIYLFQYKQNAVIKNITLSIFCLINYFMNLIEIFFENKGFKIFMQFLVLCLFGLWIFILIQI